MQAIRLCARHLIQANLIHVIVKRLTQASSVAMADFPT